MKNLPNFTLIFCRIFVVAGNSVEALRLREVGHSDYSPSAVADKRCLMLERCNCEMAGRVAADVVLDGLAVVLDVLAVVVDADTVLVADTGLVGFLGVGSGRVVLEGRGFFVLRPQPQRQLCCRGQFHCN